MHITPKVILVFLVAIVVSFSELLAQEFGTVKGSVRTFPDNIPLPNAILNITGGTSLLTSATDSDGNFSVRVPIQVSFPVPFAFVRIGVSDYPLGGQIFVQSSPYPVLLHPNQTFPGIVIYMRVANSQVQGTVTTAANQSPLQGVRIMATSPQVARFLNPNDRVERSTVTDAEGRYTLLMPDGDFLLEAALEGYLTDMARIDLSEDETLTVNFSLQPFSKKQKKNKFLLQTAKNY